LVVSPPLLEAAARICAQVTLIAVLALMPWALASLCRQWRSMKKAEQLAIALALLFAIATRFVPGRMVQVFTGYDLLDQISTHGPVPKYGAGYGAVLSPLFDLFGTSESLVFALNAVLGILSLLIAAFFIGAWIPIAGSTAATLWTLALVPLLLRHHRSESASVLAMTALLLGLLHLRQGLSDRRHLPFLASWMCCSFAAQVRPEFVLAGPIVLLAAAHWHPSAGGGGGRTRRRAQTRVAGDPSVRRALYAPGLSMERSG
jgi:hypothetical protein